MWVVWGTWNGITERDGAQAKRLRPLMRFLGGRGYLQSQGWLPHSGTTHPALFASYWPLTEGGKTTSAAWTVVSRGKAQSAHGYPKPALTNVPPPPQAPSRFLVQTGSKFSARIVRTGRA